jgi:hypothetical protein
VNTAKTGNIHHRYQGTLLARIESDAHEPALSTTIIKQALDIQQQKKKGAVALEMDGCGIGEDENGRRC